jgi:hypothetical protein
MTTIADSTFTQDIREIGELNRRNGQVSGLTIAASLATTQAAAAEQRGDGQAADALTRLAQTILDTADDLR